MTHVRVEGSSLGDAGRRGLGQPDRARMRLLLPPDPLGRSLEGHLLTAPTWNGAPDLVGALVAATAQQHDLTAALTSKVLIGQMMSVELRATLAASPALTAPLPSDSCLTGAPFGRADIGLVKG